MIEGMKRTILIPILLSTFLLAGCESEFDRCFEANIDTDIDIDEAEFMKKVDTLLEKKDESDTRYSDGELSIDEVIQIQNAFIEDFFASLSTSERELWNGCVQVPGNTLEDCLPKLKAESICHSQGIY